MLADQDGDTALMLASEEGHVEVVGLLLEAGADKDSANNDGKTAPRFPSSTRFALFGLGSPYFIVNSRRKGTLTIKGLLESLGPHGSFCYRPS